MQNLWEVDISHFEFELSGSFCIFLAPEVDCFERVENPGTSYDKNDDDGVDTSLWLIAKQFRTMTNNLKNVN